MLRGVLCRAAPVLALGLLACGGTQFTSAAGDGGSTASDAPVTVASDAPDGGCTPTAEAFCLTVQVALTPVAPSYTDSSEATALGLDGKGSLFVLLFAEDPSTHSNLAPEATFQYPDAPAQVDIKRDFPLEHSIAAKAGKHWVFAVFEDSSTAMRGSGLGAIVPGDFEIPLPIVAGSTFPTVTLDGTTAPAPVTVALKPLRGVVVTPTLTSQFVQQIKGTPSIHGSGPGVFVVGDMVKGTFVPIDFGFVGCVDLMLQNAAATAAMALPQMTFATTAPSGAHFLVGQIIDYPSATNSTAPAPGTVESDPTNPTALTISPLSWLSDVTLPFADAVDGGVPATDPTPSCP